jgi:hypothetical protein
MRDGAVTYRMKGRVALRRIGTDCLLVPVSGEAARENCVFPVNDTGEFIWERLVQGQPVEAVARQVAAEFAVPEAAALADCRAFAGELVAQRLLEEGAP